MYSSMQVYGDAGIVRRHWTLMYGDEKGTVKTVYGLNNQAIANEEGQRLIVTILPHCFRSTARNGQTYLDGGTRGRF